jgi:hypothetical protein
MAAGTEPPPASSQLHTLFASLAVGLAAIAPFVLVLSVPYALQKGSLASYAASLASLAAIAVVGWQWRQGVPGAHEKSRP